MRGGAGCCAQAVPPITQRSAAIFASAPPMGFPHFIARRILSDTDRQQRLSRPIVLIAVLGIVIGMAVMIITVGISSGFQREIRSKVVGAGSHIQVVSIGQNDPKETPRVLIDPELRTQLLAIPGVRHVQIHATKPGIIETAEEIEGVVVKGVGADFDWAFWNAHIVEGKAIDPLDSASTPGVLLSRYLAKRLAIGVNDTITIYLVKGREDIRPRKFAVKGLYETGLEKIDHQLVFIGIGVMQRFAQWGLRAEILVTDTLIGRASKLRVEGLAFGGDHLYNYEWPLSTLKGKGPHYTDLPIFSDKITLVVSDESGTLPDTAWVRITPKERRHIIDSWGEYMSFSGIEVERGGTGGTYDKYCGGYEVAIDDLDRLSEIDDAVYQALPQGLRTVTVKQRFGEIFAWLNLLDTNVVVVIALMVIVAIINMTSALLIIILERTTMIGVLKALGSSNGAIRRIFLIDAAYILGFGIVLGDLLGIGLCAVQHVFGIVRLPIESYYVDQVPVHLDPMAILALNVGTLAVCVAALVLPSWLVTRIAPARAIRFD